MKARTSVAAMGVLAAGLLLRSSPRLLAQGIDERLVRIAELEIESVHLEAYKEALRKEIEASIRLEPGVLTLYAASVNALDGAAGNRRADRPRLQEPLENGSRKNTWLIPSS